MLPYFIVNALALSFVSIGYYFKFNRVAIASVFVLSAIPLIFLTSFKHIKIGTDTSTYVYFYNKIKTYEGMVSIIGEQGEAGFWFLNYLGHFITQDFFIIFPSHLKYNIKNSNNVRNNYMQKFFYIKL